MSVLSRIALILVTNSDTVILSSKPITSFIISDCGALIPASAVLRKVLDKVIVDEHDVFYSGFQLTKVSWTVEMFPFWYFLTQGQDFKREICVIGSCLLYRKIQYPNVYLIGGGPFLYPDGV